MSHIVAMSYSGQAKVLQCQPDTAQDFADRLMRHSIDAFGSNGFPRSELAEALNASFTATSYVGPEPSPHARDLFFHSHFAHFEETQSRQVNSALLFRTPKQAIIR
jgi:hypothetical protein